MIMINLLIFIMFMIIDLKQRSDLMGLGHTRGFNENVVELLLLILSQLDDLFHQVRLEAAADAAVLHPNHRLVALDQGGLINEALVDIELGHVIDNDGTFEVLLFMLSLQNMFQQSCFARPKEAAEERDGYQVLPRGGSLLSKIQSRDGTERRG